jgi:hypothetical protein
MFLDIKPSGSRRFPRLRKGIVAMTKRHIALSRASGVLTVFSAMLFLAAVLWANDPPWMGKPYQQWDAQDVQTVFTQSPWIRVTAITRNWLPSTNGLPNDQLSGRGRGLPSSLDQSSAAAGGDVTFLVFWASSRIVRAASARNAVLRGEKKNLDVEKYAAEPQEEYHIALQSADMTPFFLKDEKFFQANAFLEMKKSKQKISPSHVRYEHAQNGAVSQAIFFFSRKTASGDPTISRDEKLVEFICNIEGSMLRVGFEPQKMVDKNGPAL